MTLDVNVSLLNLRMDENASLIKALCVKRAMMGGAETCVLDQEIDQRERWHSIQQRLLHLLTTEPTS